MKKKQLGFHLVLLGQITSGKDTQASILMKKYNLKPVESGKHWRKVAKENSKDGEWIRLTTGQGKPAPVALMKKFLIKEIKNRPKNKNFIFIGNPKLKPEAQLLKKLLDAQNENFFVIYIKLSSEKEIIKRAFFRSSGKNKRTDDLGKKVIETRIKWHNQQVGKTVKYFESLGKLKKINGIQPLGKVTKDIEKAILGFQKKIK